MVNSSVGKKKKCCCCYCGMLTYLPYRHHHHQNIPRQGTSTSTLLALPDPHCAGTLTLPTILP